MTPNSFLEKHVKDLHKMKIDYAFLRNSQEYPHKISGDVDFLVKQQDLKKIYSFFKNFFEKEVVVVQLISKRNDLYVMLFFNQGGDRKYLVLEYFTGLFFKGQVIVSGEKLLKNCEIDGIWRRLPSRVSITYTFFHYIIYKGFLPSKYQDDFNRYALDDFIVNSVKTFISDDLTNEDMDKLLSDVKIMRKKIKKRMSKIKIFFNYVDQLFRFRFQSFGCKLKVNSLDAQAAIDFADKYHLYRPTYRYIVDPKGIFPSIKSSVIVFLGGLAVVARDDVNRPGSVSEYFENHINARKL